MIPSCFYVSRVHFFGRNSWNVITRLLHPPFSSSLLVVTLALAPFVALQSNERDASADTPVAKVYVGYFPSSVAVNPITNTVFVASDRGIDVIDGATNKLVKTIQVQTEPFGSGISVNPVTNKIYASSSDGAVYTIDGSTFTVTGNMTFIPWYGVGNIAINSITNMLYVGSGTHSVFVVDGSNNRLVKEIYIINAYVSGNLAVNPMTNMIYQTGTCNGCINGTGFVSVIDGKSNTMIKQIDLGRGAVPQYIAINSITNKIYVRDLYSTGIWIIDGSTNTVTDAISAGSSSESSVESPAGIAVNPTTNKIYAPNWNISLDPGQWFLGSSIKVIDGSNNKIVQTLPVGKAVMDVAVNPVTNRIYASDSYNHRVVVIDGNGPLENAKIMIDTINGMHLKKGITKSLDSRIDGAIQSLNSGQYDDAKKYLKAFIDKVEVFSGKKLTTFQATNLIKMANDIVNSLPAK